MSDGKVCKGCTQWKPLTEYHKTNRTKDGCIARCKDCKAKYNNPVAKREYDLVYRNANRAKRLAGYRRYNEENAERIAAYNKTAHRLEISRASENRRRAIKASLPFEEYTVDDIIARDGELCWLCGKVPKKRTVEHLIAFKTKPHHLELWNLDHPGDVLDNVAIVCSLCNSSKFNHLLICAVARYLRNKRK